MFQYAIDSNELKYNDLPVITFAQRLKKAKLIAGVSQKKLSKATNLSLSTINELEAGYRDNIKISTLNKLLTVLDKDILCDDYCIFILNQKLNIEKLLLKYSVKQLTELLNIHRSTIERWRDGKYQISRKQYELMKKL